MSAAYLLPAEQGVPMSQFFQIHPDNPQPRLIKQAVEIIRKGGAYGVMNGAGRFGDSYFVSYRDPNLRETNEVYEGIVPYLEQFEADERDMTKFVIGTISDLDAPLLPPYKGIRADAAWFTGVTDAMVQKERDEILAVTPEDIRALAPIIRAVLSEQSICAIGNAEKVKANQDLFKTVKNLFN